MVVYVYTPKETAMTCALSVWKMITVNMKENKKKEGIYYDEV